MDLEIKDAWKNQKCHECGQRINEFYIKLDLGFVTTSVRLCPKCFLKLFVFQDKIFNFWNVKEKCINYIEEDKRRHKEARTFM